MHCSKCGATMTEKRGPLVYSDPLVGPLFIADASFFECTACKQVMYSLDTVDRIEKMRQERIDEEIGALPVSEFIGSKEAASLLGVSRQALHKNRRIRRGFVYSVKKEDGYMLYNVRSLTRYRDGGDGRFPFVSNAVSTGPEYVMSELVFGIPVRYRKPIMVPASLAMVGTGQTETTGVAHDYAATE